ncbi:MAG: hypothetical protein ACLFP4_00640 [Spirochaetales bacterium]
MFGFLIKKAFFDMWDNFLGVVIMNLGFIALLSLPFLLPQAVAPFGLLPIVLVHAVSIVLISIYSGVVAMMARDIANYERPEFTKFVPYLRETWVSSTVFGLIFVGIGLVLFIGFPVYANMGNLLGFAAIVFLGWALIIWLFASQFFFPIRAQLDSQNKKVLRKCFVVFFDNTFFSILLGIGSLAIAIGSFFTAFLLPGFAGLVLWHQVALKLRLYKYDYLEENPDANRKSIPWDALLIEDRDRVGKRTLRGMIFPWKE